MQSMAIFLFWFSLVWFGLWHINYCRLFNAKFIFMHINSSIPNISVRTQFISIRSIDRTLSDTTTPGQSGPESDGNERVLRIPQSSCITESYLRHSLGWFYPFIEMQFGAFYNSSQLSQNKFS